MSELRSPWISWAEIDHGALSEDALLDLAGELVTASNRITASLTASCEQPTGARRIDAVVRSR